MAAGALLWLLSLAVFLRAYRRQKRTADELAETQEVTILAMADQAELGDRQTGRHAERTATYVRVLAEELALLPSYRRYLTAAYVRDLVKSAPLHDIGKAGIADAILLKPDGLTEEEMQEIRRHCEYGARVLRGAEHRLKFPSFLRIAIALTLSHHEKWDGTGYPHGLRGDAIPVSGRIMALADTYDALRRVRPYRQAMSHEETRAAIMERRGTHFDPAVVDAFLRREDEFRRISEDLGDDPTRY